MYQLHALTDVPEDELRDRALARLGEVGLGDHADVMPDQLSGGMRTRAALARALVSDPDFALLDSVDHGIDPVRLGLICDLIRWHRDTLGGSYLVTTHDMDVAQRLADHIVVLWDGRVVEQGPAQTVFASHREEIRQLLAGGAEGPLALHSEARVGPAPHLPAEQGFDVPVELAAGATLVAITVSVLVLGSGHPLELALVAIVWFASAALVVKRLRRGR
jgi:ABC-type transporter Mla maintaining outer membrane lipid asymmetry ATPase subunit MlaF